MNKTTHLLLLLALTIALLGSCQRRISSSFTFETGNRDAITEYAVSELEHFLYPLIMKDSTAGNKHITFRLHTDTTLQEGAFTIRSGSKRDRYEVLLTGHTPSDILCAAYTFLEKGGFVFDITGPVTPENSTGKQ
jgi:hypothetical protein